MQNKYIVNVIHTSSSLSGDSEPVAIVWYDG